VVGLFEKLCACQNREIVYDLYSYVWDICNVILTLNGFVQWLSRGVCSPKLQSYVVGQQTWFSGIREAFLSGDHEPWVFRGGLISDLLRLLPLDSGHDLYMYKYPEVPLNLLYNIRPFEPKDQVQVYALAANLYAEEIMAPMGLCESDRVVVGDKRVGAYLTLFPQYCFVTENMSDGSIAAFALTCPDATQFYAKHNSAWLPEMRQKYPRKASNEGAMFSPIEDMMLSFHLEDEVHELPACLTAVAPNPADPAAAGSSSTPSGNFQIVYFSRVS
jgi:protein O-GlcNAcase/histone acetyltransferase